MSRLPCPCCGKPVDAFEARTIEREVSGSERVLIYLHADWSRCEIRVPTAAERRPRARRRVLRS